MTDAVIHDLYRLLINRVDCYLTWYQSRWVLRRAPLTAALLAQAVAGHLHLGIQAVSGSGMTRWTCLDVDNDAQFEPLAELANDLPTETRLLERSRRGGHLWLFHSQVDWQTAHQRGVEFAERVGLGKIEVYPKYDGVHAVRLIGTVHPKTGSTYPIVEPTTGEMLDLPVALTRIVPAYLASFKSARTTDRQVTVQPATTPAAFDDLFALLGQLTTLRPYGNFKASGKCPWHDDDAPSFYVRGRRFHCLACGVWGDAADVRRYLTKGIRPPSQLRVLVPHSGALVVPVNSWP